MSSADRAQVVEAAHALSGLGLVTAYGHVSVRAGDRMLITPAGDLAAVSESTVVEVALAATELPPGVAAESWSHLALYRARPDAAAIARAQPPAAFAVAAAVATLPPLYGQAAWLGESVPVHGDARLLRSAELAEAAARALPAGEALLLRGNGALTLGATAGLAVARMWLLAAACECYLAATAATAATAAATGPAPAATPSAGPARPAGAMPLTAAEIEFWRAVAGELLPRLWEHLRRRSAGAPRPAAGPA